MSVRLTGPDQLRGLLLTIVIYGHTYAASIHDDRSKWLIYAFHMPAFLVLSGWLWRESSLVSRTLPELLGYLWRRMLWQWLLVSVLFNGWRGDWPHSLREALHLYVITPTYHLWFIPALVIMLVVTHVVLRAGCGWGTLTGMAVLSLVVFELPTRKFLLPTALSHIEIRYGAYYVWFLLGFAVRNAPSIRLRSVPARLWLPGALLGAVAYLLAFGANPWLRDGAFLLLNGMLALGLPQLLGWLERPLPLIGSAMVTVGRDSLWVYLLHPFIVVEVVKRAEGGLFDRGVGVITTVLVVVATVAIDRLVRAWKQRRTRSMPYPPGVAAESTSVAPGDEGLPPVSPPPVPQADLPDERGPSLGSTSASRSSRLDQSDELGEGRGAHPSEVSAGGAEHAPGGP